MKTKEGCYFWREKKGKCVVMDAEPTKCEECLAWHEETRKEAEDE